MIHTNCHVLRYDTMMTGYAVIHPVMQLYLTKFLLNLQNESDQYQWTVCGRRMVQWLAGLE